jgi:hypothetical protein
MHRGNGIILGALAALLPALAGPAAAADGCPAPGEVAKNIKQVFKRDIEVSAVAPSRLKGLCEIQVSFQGRPNILYTDAAGAYFVTGHLIDAKAGLDLTEESLAALNAFSADDMKQAASLAALTLGTKGPVVYFATDPM